MRYVERCELRAVGVEGLVVVFDELLYKIVRLGREATLSQLRLLAMFSKSAKSQYLSCVCHCLRGQQNALAITHTCHVGGPKTVYERASKGGRALAARGRQRKSVRSPSGR